METNTKSTKASLIDTQLFTLAHSDYNWNDLVLDQETLDELENIKTWVQHRKDLSKNWGISGPTGITYLALFSGPSGTGKTLAATLIGKETRNPVYRIDLSAIVSKYIGETEKNLSALLANAAYKGAILLFDEADALFGKRAEVKDAHDRYANLEVSYLMQKLETYPGLVIFIQNQQLEIDDAFLRRFDNIVYFPFPHQELRSQLWKQYAGNKIKLAKDVDLDELSKNYELNGSDITKVIRNAVLTSIRKGEKEIGHNNLLTNIGKLLGKKAN
ncbi:MAG: ATP-binding protein [Saprospiraceae bacterium]|nr:ATP-binding protein [Saprospiraceae bacterium]MCB9343698.1 ATP-binding protein [Lewinellaceae bacterium]